MVSQGVLGMKRFLYACVFTVFAGISVFSQGLTIVVAPFDIRAGFSESEAENIIYFFTDELAKDKTLKVVDQRQGVFNELINRMKFEVSDWSNNDKVAQFGQALNANAVILGRMTVLGDQRIIAARILDVRTTQILATSQMDVKNVGEVRGKLPAFTKGIINNLPKPPPPPLVNPFPGRWRSTVTSNGRTLICILSFSSDGRIDVEQYDTNRVTRRGGGMTYSNDLKKGKGNGSYSYRESGNNVIVDISLTISGVSSEFTAVTTQGNFSISNPNRFTANSMKCEYYVSDGRISDFYKEFHKL